MYHDFTRELMQKNVPILKGTTTIGVVCSDGVVLTTDTRATMGYFVAHKKAKKVFQIDDHLAMTIAGAVGDAQTAVEFLKANSNIYRYSQGKALSVKSAARLIANLLSSNRYMPLLLQAIIAGFDTSGAHVFALDPLGGLIEEKCVSTGSGSPIAYGVLESDYKEDMKVDKVLPIVIKAITSAMKRDAASGDSFDVVTVTSDGYKELSESEKLTLAKSLN